MQRQQFKWKSGLTMLAIVWCVSAAWVIHGQAQASPPSTIKVSGQLFTKAQALRGEKIFRTQCAGCHRENLHTGEGDMLLTGPHFLERWGLVTLGDMVTLIRETMPADAPPNTLTLQEGTDLVAYILWLNYFEEGTKELPADLATLNRWRLQTPQEHLQMFIR